MSRPRVWCCGLFAAAIALGACAGNKGDGVKGEEQSSDSGVLDSDSPPGPGSDSDSGSGPVDADGDGFYEDDCDDADADVHPGAFERCNGRDDDCNGIVDSDTEGWVDEDGDGYGTEPVSGCDDPSLPLGPEGGDCDDAVPEVHPGAAEVPCDGEDQDCDGLLTEVATVEGAASYDSVQAAVEAAPEAGTVWVCDGTWAELIDISEGRSLTLAGWSGDATRAILDGQDLAPLLYLRAGATLTLEDLTFTRGSGTGEDDILYQFGGAVTVDMASLIARRLYFLSNSTPFGGGAVLILQDTDGSGRGSAASFEDCDFEENSAPIEGWGGGGAIEIGGFLGHADLMVEGSRFERNSAEDAGGTLNSVGHGSVDIRISDTDIIDSSSASSGGAVSVWTNMDGTVELDRVRVRGGESPQDGGAVFAGTGVYTHLDLAIRDSTFSDCIADNGGALHLTGYGSGSFTIERSVFQGSESFYAGGAVYVARWGMQSLRIEDSLIEANRTDFLGGGLFVTGKDSDTPPEVVLERTTIRDNDAVIAEGSPDVLLGGGIYLSDRVDLTVIDCDLGEDELDNWPNDLKTPSGSYEGLGAGETFTCTSDNICTGIP